MSKIGADKDLWQRQIELDQVRGSKEIIRVNHSFLKMLVNLWKYIKMCKWKRYQFDLNERWGTGEVELQLVHGPRLCYAILGVRIVPLNRRFGRLQRTTRQDNHYLCHKHIRGGREGRRGEELPSLVDLPSSSSSSSSPLFLSFADAVRQRRRTIPPQQRPPQ